MRRSLISFTLALAALTAVELYAQATPNPYGVAGYGVLSKLGMPAGCIDYDWNGLHAEIPVQMCRPNHYYNYIGIPPRWWGYNELTDEINDPTRFATWVAAYPGKIWIIGNEPDLYSQDGLTKEQYARMFKKYYDFIKPIDPTAKFAIGAITGGSTTAGLNYSTAWYQDVLNIYKTLYGGATMPIDIWNIHSYCGATQIEDPDKIINDFVTPFVNWCHTVENGAYAGCEVWITELPYGEWMGALNQEWVIWFAQKYLPRLERAGISRWFWYVSVDWDRSSYPVALLDYSRQVTPLGQAYAALANGYPNTVPPVSPYVPAPTPVYLTDSFDAPLSEPWMVKAGVWTSGTGELRQSRVNYPWWGESCVLQHIYGDFECRFRAKINNSGGDPQRWVGFCFRLAGRFHVPGNSGYLVYLRQNGELGLYCTGANPPTVASVPGCVADTSTYHDISLSVVGSRITIFVDGVQQIDWTDTNNRYTSGYMAFMTARIDASYDDFRISSSPIRPPVVTDEGMYTTSTTLLRASWTTPDPGSGIAEYSYAVGTTPGGSDVVPWTSAGTNTQADIPAALTPGNIYFISVRALDGDGFWSAPGSSDGIRTVSAVGFAAAKTVPDGTYAAVEGIVTAGTNNFTGLFFVEAVDRSSAIKCYPAAGVTVATGDWIKALGTTSTSGGERALSSVEAQVISSGNPVPAALLLNSLALGGGAFSQYALGVTGGVGLNNVALLVSVFGRVTSVSTSGKYFTLDPDGAGLSNPNCPTVRVDWGLTIGGITPPASNDYVVVTGISAMRTSGSGRVRMLRPRSSQDVVRVLP